MPRGRKYRKKAKNKGTRIMTINVPEKYIALFDMLIDFGIVKSRSEGIRTMMTEWFTEKLKMVDDIDKLIELGKTKMLELENKLLDKELSQKIKAYELTHQETLENGTRLREYVRTDAEIIRNKAINED